MYITTKSTKNLIPYCGLNTKLELALMSNNLYRINGPAGTQLSEEIVEIYHCGTSATGWLNGTHPTVFNEIVDRNVCFHSINGDPCLYQSAVQILNCGEFYLYS